MPAKREEGHYEARTKEGKPCSAAGTPGGYAFFMSTLTFSTIEGSLGLIRFFSWSRKFFAVGETLQAAVYI